MQHRGGKRGFLFAEVNDRRRASQPDPAFQRPGRRANNIQPNLPTQLLAPHPNMKASYIPAQKYREVILKKGDFRAISGETACFQTSCIGIRDLAIFKNG